VRPWGTRGVGTRAAQVRGQSRAWVLSAWMEVRLCWSET